MEEYQKKGNNLLVPNLQYCQFEQIYITEKKNPSHKL